ncbi:MAG: hypothetical protein H0T59_07765 [Chloroflexi bacterium]|nr:hypothetical protein [Chloroflexota bacterium]
MRWPILALLIVGGAWVVVGAVLPPFLQTCDPALTEPVCAETIDASLRKGMPPLHPWLLGAHAEPGPAARPDQFGHRATVTFAVLGLPDPVSVRMFFDAGAHWGGIADPDGLLVAGFAVLSGVAIGAAAAAGWWLMIHRRHRASADPSA